MYDPLGTSPFADDTPPWPTTPHPPNSPIPNLRRASYTQPASSEKTPSTLNQAEQHGKEPQIYGQPEAGLISPTANTASNGTKYEKLEPYLRARITMLDRNRRDILIRFDAQVCNSAVELFHLFRSTCWHRQISQTSLVPHIATSRGPMPSSSNSTKPLYRVTPRPSSLPCL